MKHTVEFEIDEKMFKNIINKKENKRIAEILGNRAIKELRLKYYKFQSELEKLMEKWKSKPGLR
jgi:uncharacterized protein involved in exopolysaccharide biosynthesis